MSLEGDADFIKAGKAPSFEDRIQTMLYRRPYTEATEPKLDLVNHCTGPVNLPRFRDTGHR